MFKMDSVELARLNRRPGLPKPGRVHGGGGKLRGKKDDKFIDVRSSVNKLNPAIRGQTNIVHGKFVEPHESDDANATLACKMYSVPNHVGHRPRRKPLRCRVG